jgi:hypothetical protein
MDLVTCVLLLSGSVISTPVVNAKKHFHIISNSESHAAFEMPGKV